MRLGRSRSLGLRRRLTLRRRNLRLSGCLTLGRRSRCGASAMSIAISVSLRHSIPVSQGVKKPLQTFLGKKRLLSARTKLLWSLCTNFVRWSFKIFAP